jgi:hypothetical protein
MTQVVYLGKDLKTWSFAFFFLFSFCMFCFDYVWSTKLTILAKEYPSFFFHLHTFKFWSWKWKKWHFKWFVWLCWGKCARRGWGNRSCKKILATTYRVHHQSPYYKGWGSLENSLSRLKHILELLVVIP